VSRLRTAAYEQAAWVGQTLARVVERVEAVELGNAAPGATAFVASSRLDRHCARDASLFNDVRNDEQVGEIPSGMKGLLEARVIDAKATMERIEKLLIMGCAKSG